MGGGARCRNCIPRRNHRTIGWSPGLEYRLESYAKLKYFSISSAHASNNFYKRHGPVFTGSNPQGFRILIPAGRMTAR